jgi:protein-S-isoprenylcysteine O-methyltransferase Ste14
LGRIPRPVGSVPALAGLVAGFVTVFSLFLLTRLAWPWYPLVGTLVTVVVALLLDRWGFRSGPLGPD